MYATGSAYAPADDRKSRDAVIVAHIGNKLLMQRQRQRRISCGNGKRHDGSRVGDDLEAQLGRDALERRTLNRAYLQSPRPAGERSKPAFNPVSLDALCFSPAASLQGPGGGGEWHARRGAREDRGAGR